MLIGKGKHIAVEIPQRHFSLTRCLVISVMSNEILGINHSIDLSRYSFEDTVTLPFFFLSSFSFVVVW